MRAILLFVAALVAGCAAVPERAPLADPASAWRARQTALAQTERWELRGRLALRSADDGFNVSVRWQREAQQHRIDLTGPLGGGRVRLTQDASGAELRDANDQMYRDSSVQQLLLRRTGWDLPLDGLNYWVLGLPAPGAPAQSEIDAWGRLAVLDQMGWDIRFRDYAQYGAHELPSRIFITRKPDAMNRTLDVRLVVDTWVLRE